LELDPEHKEAAYNYATCCLYTENFKDGIVAAEQCSVHYPEYPLLHAVLAALYLAEGDVVKSRLTADSLKKLNYAVERYLLEQAGVLSAQGLATLASRLRQEVQVGGCHPTPSQGCN
jgi:hypothetical protein